MKKPILADKNETSIREQIESDLSNLYGPVLTSRDIAKVMGFTNTQAMRQALAKGRLNLPLFTMEGRKGKFALTKEIAGYVAAQRMALDIDRKKKMKEMLESDR